MENRTCPKESADVQRYDEALRILRYYKGLELLIEKGYIKDAEALLFSARVNLGFEIGSSDGVKELDDSVFQLVTNRMKLRKEAQKPNSNISPPPKHQERVDVFELNEIGW